MSEKRIEQLEVDVGILRGQIPTLLENVELLQKLVVERVEALEKLIVADIERIEAAEKLIISISKAGVEISGDGQLQLDWKTRDAIEDMERKFREVERLERTAKNHNR